LKRYLKVTLRNRTVDELLGLPWSKEVVAHPLGGFIARVPELDGCFAGGDTEAEALADLDVALAGWLELAVEKGEAIPEPRMMEDAPYSGRFSVRVPRFLHRQLVERSEQEGSSLNQLLSVYLTKLVSTPTSAGTASRAEVDRDLHEGIIADAVRSGPPAIAPLKGVANVLRKRGDVELACLLYALAAHRMTGTRSPADISRELGVTAAMARREHRDRIAEALLIESLRMDDKNLRSSSALGQSLYQRGRYAEAAGYLERPAEVDERARLLLGWSRLLLGIEENDALLEKEGLVNLSDALRKWSYQNGDKSRRQSWIRQVSRLASLGSRFTHEVEQLREFANANSRWGPIEPEDLDTPAISDDETDFDLTT
jgi:predicted RNase H-like HicB family nuclease